MGAKKKMSTCTLHQMDGSCQSLGCYRVQGALGTKYLYFRWKKAILWSSMHHVEFVLPNMTCSFFVRLLQPVLRHSVMEKKTYHEHLFWQDNRCMIVRRRLGEPDIIVLQHTPEFA